MTVCTTRLTIYDKPKENGHSLFLPLQIQKIIVIIMTNDRLPLSILVAIY